MSYVVSPKVKELLEQIIALKEVQTALKFIEDDQDQTLENQIELTKIEAPTFHEENKAKRYLEMFKDLGLENAEIDSYGNVTGIRKGEGGKRKLVVEGHLDTVFPLGTVIDPQIRDGKVYAPGICDDTRGLVVNLTVIRALKAAGIKTGNDILFGGTVQEEGMGGLMGMKKLLEFNKDVTECLCVDGFSAKGIVYQATGFRTCEVNFYGIGGHAYGAFGYMANALHAASRAVAKIADFQVPADPRTTFCVSNFHAGNDASIHAIVPKATIKFNFRSNSMEELNKLDDRIKAAIQEACDEESARWGADTITWDYKQYIDVGAGKQDEHAPIVEADHAVIEYLGYDPLWIQGGSTNANVPISQGIPALCLGLSDEDNKVHSLDEYFPIKDSYKGAQQALLLALMLSGIAGKTDPLLEM